MSLSHDYSVYASFFSFLHQNGCSTKTSEFFVTSIELEIRSHVSAKQLSWLHLSRFQYTQSTLLWIFPTGNIYFALCSGTQLDKKTTKRCFDDMFRYSIELLKHQPYKLQFSINVSIDNFSLRLNNIIQNFMDVVRCIGFPVLIDKKMLNF